MDKLGKAPQKTKQQVQRQRGGSNMPGPVRGSPLLVEKAEETFMGRISKGRMPVQGAWAWVVGTKAKSREVSDLHFNKTIHLVLKEKTGGSLGYEYKIPCKRWKATKLNSNESEQERLYSRYLKGGSDKMFNCI